MSCGILLLILALGLVVLLVAANQLGETSASPGGERSLRPSSRQFVASPAPSQRRRGLSKDGDRFWVSPGETVRVGRFEIPGGMLFVGSDLQGLNEWRAPVEPALIDPKLPINPANPDHAGQDMSYWPSYSEIPARCRGAYLHWLANGRSDPSAYIGYVFLFFYGIERRVLADARKSERAAAEAPELLAEVERLVSIYGSNNSFASYARNFLSVGRWLANPEIPDDLEPPKAQHGWDVPLEVKIALAGFVKKGEPIAAEWALTWFLTSNESRLRTPAQRCAEEFGELFRVLYRQRYPKGGLRLQPNKTELVAQYRPASPSFSSTVELTFCGLPDVTRRTAPLRKLQEIADEAMSRLDAYSRWMGRNGEGTSPAALALLPPEIAASRRGAEARDLTDWIEKTLADKTVEVVPSAEVLERWPTKTPGKITRKESELLAAFYARGGFGVEPDPRFGGPVLSKTAAAAIFRLPDSLDMPQTPSPGYQAAALLLHLAAAVSAADGEVSESEERHLAEHLEEALQLDAEERARLGAHLVWLLADPPGLSGLKQRIEPLDAEDRRRMAQFLITVAGADGHVSVEELKLLSKIYPLLGLEAAGVYADVHALTTAGPGLSQEPVTIVPAESGASGFRIPARSPRGSEGGFTLDMEKIRVKRKETEVTRGILARVFEGEDEDGPSAHTAGAVSTAEAGAPAPAGDTEEVPLVGLDAGPSALLRRLAAKNVWERLELEALAGELELLLDGALEEINEAAFEKCEAPLFEGDDPVELDSEVLKELLA